MTPQEKEHYTKLAEHYNSDRDCNSCIHHTEKGCSAWECKYVSREQALRAVEAWKKEKKGVFDDLELTEEEIRAFSNSFARALDPEWQEAHAKMGFYSPMYELEKALGEVGEKE